MGWVILAVLAFLGLGAAAIGERIDARARGELPVHTGRTRYLHGAWTFLKWTVMFILGCLGLWWLIAFALMLG